MQNIPARVRLHVIHFLLICFEFSRKSRSRSVFFWVIELLDLTLIGSDWTELDWTESDWTELDWIGFNWIGLDRI